MGVMNGTIVFLESYGRIEYDLSVAIRDWRDRSITIVVPGNRDLFKFLRVLNEKVFGNRIHLLNLEPYRPRRAQAKGVSKIFHALQDVMRERRYLKEIFDKYFAELEGCEVFFHSRGYSSLKCYLLKKLSKKNRLTYICHGPPYMGKYTPRNVVDLARLIILKLINGRDIALGQFPDKSPHDKGFAYLPDEFMKSKVGRVIDWAEKSEMSEGFDLSQFKVFDVGNYSVIYFDEGLMECDYMQVDKSKFGKELGRIFDILSKYFPEKEIARKYHPGYSSDKTMIKIGDVLPDFIPAELLYDDGVKMYLSVFSFSIANVEKGLAVSIADLISFKSDELKNRLKERLIQRSKSKIVFPESLDEFERILIDLKEQRNERLVSIQL